MRGPKLLLVNVCGQPYPEHIDRAVVRCASRVRQAYPLLDDVTLVEVLEEAARRVERRESAVGPLAHLNAYAWTAVRSVVLSRLRLGRERLAQNTTFQADAEAVAGRRAGVSGPSPVETRVLVRQMLLRLTPIERRVLALKVAGFSTREIALQVDRATTTVDSIHSRSMARLRVLMAPQAPARSRGSQAGRG